MKNYHTSKSFEQILMNREYKVNYFSQNGDKKKIVG
jgi:hypothetical protein